MKVRVTLKHAIAPHTGRHAVGRYFEQGEPQELDLTEDEIEVLESKHTLQRDQLTTEQGFPRAPADVLKLRRPLFRVDRLEKPVEEKGEASGEKSAPAAPAKAARAA